MVQMMERKKVICERARECIPKAASGFECPHSMEHEHGECCDCLACYFAGRFNQVKCIGEKSGCVGGAMLYK